MATAQDQGARIDRVETDVNAIRGELGGLKADVSSLGGDVRALGGILGRIEKGVENAQDRHDEKEMASRPNLVAVISILITIITIIVGGAWTIGGSLARLDERDGRRDDEVKHIWRTLERGDDRAWKEREQGDRTDERTRDVPRENSAAE